MQSGTALWSLATSHSTANGGCLHYWPVPITKAIASKTRPDLCVTGRMGVWVGLLFILMAQPGWGQTTAGDPVRGKRLATACFACHGADGNSPSPVNPRIGGQHEEYLFLALKGYLNGNRSDSLMAGAVLNKSEQDLRDIAAYYARQSGHLAAPAGKPVAGQTDGRQARNAGVMRFDHGERSAEFTRLVAQADWLMARSAAVDEAACDVFKENAAGMNDSDSDGVADAYDAAPKDSAEFAADTNQDGFLELCNIYQLQAIASPAPETRGRLARAYQLLNDLDASSLGDFRPIGGCGPTGNCMLALGKYGFAGVFDGRGHTVRNLTVKRPESSGVGLFGVLAETGVVMNLNLDNAQVEGRAGVGALVGSNFGVLFESQASGAVSGSLAVGGLVGGSGGLVYGSGFRGTVTGQQAVGGLVGDMTGAVYQSRADVEVTGQRGIGGLVGLNTFGSVLGSSVGGVVTGSNDIGGLVGVNTDARIRHSFATADVTADGNNIGGLVGFNSLSTVRNSYATGAVTGRDGVGGLAGRNNGVVENSFAAGRVRGSGLAGGVVGIVVEGQQSGTYTVPDNDTPYGGLATDLKTLSGESTGWAPSRVPAVDLLRYFCDQNRNGFIDPAEATNNNYIWQFRSGDLPSLRCAAGT